MAWDDSEQSYKNKANTGHYFKLQDDGDTARIVLLTEPDEQEKDGNNGLYTVWSIDLWNVEGGKRQTWDMGSSQFKSLLGFKRAIGMAKLYSQELVVVRTGKKGDTQTTYTWAADGPIAGDTLDAMEAAGVAPARQATASSSSTRQAPTQSRQAPTQKAKAPTVGDLEGGMVLATSKEDLRVEFEKAWHDADGHDAVQDQLQARYEQLLSALDKPAAEAPKKRAPAF